MTSSVVESGNNVRGLRSIKVDFSETSQSNMAIFFPDDHDLNLDLTDMDLVEFWISHWNLIGIDKSNVEFRLKTKGNNYYKSIVNLQSNNWMRHQIYKSQFSTVGSPNWNNINTIEYYFPGTGTTNLDEDFESALSTWTLNFTPTNELIERNTNRPKNGSYSLMLWQNTDGNGCEAYKTFTEYSSGVIKIEWWFNIDAAEASDTYMYFNLNDAGEIQPTTIFMYTDRNNFRHQPGGGGPIVLCSVTQDAWYRIVIIANLDTDKYDIYCYNEDGTLRGSATQNNFYESGNNIDQFYVAIIDVSMYCTLYVDDIIVTSEHTYGSFQFDGFVIRRREISAIAENIESQKIWGVRDLSLLDKDLIDKNTAQELVNTILYYSQYPTIRTDAQSPLIKEDILGKSAHITSKGMKWLLPIHHVKAQLTSQKEIMSLQLGRKTPSIEEILSTYGIDQDRIKIGGSGIDWGAIIEQFDKACFQTCETTCQVCGYGAVCESSCQKTGCLDACQISLCMTACQTIRDRYENWCSGSNCQTCAEAGPIV